MATISAPASQESSHVGNAGVGDISMRGAPLSLPTFATAQVKGCNGGLIALLRAALGHGLAHLLVESAAEIGFQWDSRQLGWERLGCLC